MIELTDGWYSIRALVDRPLTRLLNDGKLVVGQKLCVYGAELVGSEQAVSPLEVHFCSMWSLTVHNESNRRLRTYCKVQFKLFLFLPSCRRLVRAHLVPSHKQTKCLKAVI